MIDLDYEKKEFIKIYGEIYIGEDSTWMGWQRRARLAKAEQEKLEAEFNAQLAQVEQGIDAMAQGFLAEIESLKAQLAQYQSDDYVLVPKDQIEIFWQDDDEPENFCSLESDLDCLGESYDVGDIMVINKTSSAHIKTEKLYGVSMPCKAVSILSRKSKLVLFDNYDDAHKAMIEAQEQHNAKP